MSKRKTNEIRVEASSNGRRITLDPIKEFTLSIYAKEVESTIPCGFRQQFLSASEGGKTIFEMASGAGLGNSWLTFDYKGKQYAIDAKDIATALIAAIDAEARP